MNPTIEETQLIVSTALLLPAIVALIAYSVRSRRVEASDCWDPARCPEKDWWSEDDPR